MVPLSRVKAIIIRTRRVLLGRIEPWERMNRAITFFGQIFQPFQKTSSLRAPPRKYCVAYACAPKRLLTLYNSVGRATAFQPTLAACWFFHHPIHKKSNETASDFCLFKPLFRSRSPLLTGSRLIFLPLATQMFQFAKFEKSKERRLATELGYGFPIGDPWITDALSPHGLSPLKASFLLNARASIQCMIFDSFHICGRLNTHPISILHRDKCTKRTSIPDLNGFPLIRNPHFSKIEQKLSFDTKRKKDGFLLFRVSQITQSR